MRDELNGSLGPFQELSFVEGVVEVGPDQQVREEQVSEDVSHVRVPGKSSFLIPTRQNRTCNTD